MNYSPVDNVHALPQDQGSYRRDEPIELTPEELRVLRECSREGVVTRAIPLGVIGGIAGLMGARGGPLMNSKFGVKPAVIGLGLVGYFLGRISYSRICFERALRVPNGTLRKYYDQKNTAKEYIDPADRYYATVEPSHDPGFPGRALNSDIDIPTTGSFDTTPSDFYRENVEAQPKEMPPENYTSYDDLRKQNREEYSKRMYSDTVRRSHPQEGLPRRPPPSQPQSPEQPGGIKTKYGDVWDA